MTGTGTPVVLVVDDEPDLADIYAHRLSDEFVVETAYDGHEALESLDETIDVILLDRRMPEMSGDEVLEEVRRRGLDCRVAMVTAIDPDFDILEMGFDKYLVKPVSTEELRETVETLLTRKQYDTATQRYYQLVSKRAALESRFGDTVADESKYRKLQAEIERLEAEIEGLVTSFEDEAFEAQVRKIQQDTPVEVPKGEERLS